MQQPTLTRERECESNKDRTVLYYTYYDEDRLDRLQYQRDIRCTVGYISQSKPSTHFPQPWLSLLHPQPLIPSTGAQTPLQVRSQQHSTVPTFQQTILSYSTQPHRLNHSIPSCNSAHTYISLSDICRDCGSEERPSCIRGWNSWKTWFYKP